MGQNFLLTILAFNLEVLVCTKLCLKPRKLEKTLHEHVLVSPEVSLFTLFGAPFPSLLNLGSLACGLLLSTVVSWSQQALFSFTNLVDSSSFDLLLVGLLLIRCCCCCCLSNTDVAGTLRSSSSLVLAFFLLSWLSWFVLCSNCFSTYN